MSESNLSYSYKDKKVFIGIDVHRRSYSVTAICDEIVVKRWRMTASAEELVSLLKRYFLGAELYTVYEAGFSGFGLSRTLDKAGINNIVVNAGSIETSARDKVKTDKKDSLKLATHLSLGRLNGIRIPSEENEEHRQLCRTRTQQVRNRVRIMNQLRMKLHYHSLLPAECQGVLQRSLVESLAKTQPKEISESFESLCRVWEVLDLEINSLTKKLSEQAKRDDYEKIYRSIPGIGSIASRILSTELGDMTQFVNEKALFSYTGLTPMEFSSGENRRLGHISRQGNSRLRAVLIECAWVAIRKDPDLKKSFLRIASRSGKKRAIVAIARKLIGRARSLLKQGVLYELNFNQAA
jgi:transposase